MSVASIPPWPGRPALFVDLDGTLLEIADDPGAVFASDRLKALLGKLPAATDGAVAVVSGRPLADVDRLIAPHRFPVAGVHGLERRDAQGRLLEWRHGGELAAVREKLAAFAARHPGLLVEDKRLAVTLHYRKRPELEPDVLALSAALDAELSADLEQLRGRKVIEVKHAGMSKGVAIEEFMGEPPFRGRQSVFVGDDTTDETGFRVVNRLGGVSVKVGAGPTEARWRLANVEAVLQWLERAVQQGAERREGRLHAQ